jgi:hypothetical protein
MVGTTHTVILNGGRGIGQTQKAADMAEALCQRRHWQRAKLVALTGSWNDASWEFACVN